MLLIILILIAIGVGVIVHVALIKSDDDTGPRPPREILFGNEYEDETSELPFNKLGIFPGRLFSQSLPIVPNLGNGHLVIDRKQWGSTEVNADGQLPLLKHPIPYVLVSHVGVQSNPCDNVYNCSIKMRTIQDSAIAERSLDDLPANFYVSQSASIGSIRT